MSLLLAPMAVQGGGAGAIVLADAIVHGVRTAEWVLGQDGFTYTNLGPANVLAPAWINPQFGMEEFEALATALDTDPPLGTFDTWLDCANSWLWGWRGATVPHDGSFQLQIRDKATHTIQATRTIEIIVDGPTYGGRYGGGFGGYNP